RPDRPHALSVVRADSGLRGLGTRLTRRVKPRETAVALSTSASAWFEIGFDPAGRSAQVFARPRLPPLERVCRPSIGNASRGSRGPCFVRIEDPSFGRTPRGKSPGEPGGDLLPEVKRGRNGMPQR